MGLKRVLQKAEVIDRERHATAFEVDARESLKQKTQIKVAPT